MANPKRRTVVIGILGTVLDSGFHGEQWRRWRPSVSLGQHEDLEIRTKRTIWCTSRRGRTSPRFASSSSRSRGISRGASSRRPRAASQATDSGILTTARGSSVTSGSASQAHSGLRTLFDSGKAAFVCNAGPLLQPLTRAEYDAGAPRPAQLFSHNDQELLWHVGMGTTGESVARYGWGGRVARATAGGSLPNGLSPTLSVADVSKKEGDTGATVYEFKATLVGTGSCTVNMSQVHVTNNDDDVATSDSSAVIRSRVMAARARQAERFATELQVLGHATPSFGTSGAPK